MVAKDQIARRKSPLGRYALRVLLVPRPSLDALCRLLRGGLLRGHAQRWSAYRGVRWRRLSGTPLLHLTAVPALSCDPDAHGVHVYRFYKKIITVLASGSKERTEICKILNIEPNGRISEYLHELQLAGFIKRDHTWNISSGADSKLSKYRLSDNYLRFYLKYIDINLSKISRNSYSFKSLTALPEWDTVMGFQFENLILNNRDHIHNALNINPDEIITENPFYQTKKYSSPGCQIDYMIQTRFGTLYICEIKFSKNKVNNFIIQEMQKKIDRLRYQRGISCRPVLIHINGVTDDVKDSGYFASIIDASDFMK
jgi:hypothetical protein